MVHAAMIPFARSRLLRTARALWPAIAALLALGAPAPPPAPPNVVVISLDTLRADRVGAYGYERSTSPELDRFSRGSVVLADVLSQAPTTAPSHRSLFTGRYVYEHSNEPSRFPTMAEMFREAGYETAAFVDGGQLTKDFALHRGFDTYESTRFSRELGQRTTGGLAELAPKAIAWLARERDRPFLMFLHTYDIHWPYAPPEPYMHLYTGARRVSVDLDRGPVLLIQRVRKDIALHPFLSDRYDGGVRYTDWMLGRVLGAIESLGLAEETIVVVVSDHGESLGERSRLGHNEVFEVQLRVPVLIHVPRTEPRVIRDPAQLVDVLPTMLALAGLDAGVEFSGMDLSDAITRGARLSAERFRLGEHRTGESKSARTDGRWTLHLAGGRPTALFDLDVDPAEETDVLDARPGISARILDAYTARGIPDDTFPSVPERLTDETRAALEALGYIGD